MKENIRRRLAWIMMITGGLSSLISISVMEEEDFSIVMQALKVNVQQHASFTFLNLWFIAGIILLASGIFLGAKKYQK